MIEGINLLRYIVKTLVDVTMYTQTKKYDTKIFFKECTIIKILEIKKIKKVGINKSEITSHLTGIIK
jgi:exopolysaccharide biosynthesis protein